MSMSEYIDGDLEQSLCEALKRHLRGCERCRVVFDTTRKTIRFYREEEAIRIPVRVRNRLDRAIRSHWKIKRKGRGS